MSITYTADGTRYEVPFVYSASLQGGTLTYEIYLSDEMFTITRYNVVSLCVDLICEE